MPATRSIPPPPTRPIRLPPTRSIRPLPTRWRRAPLTGSGARRVAVAVTGGIGAGKSEALKAFGRHGAATISSDEIVHGLLREDPDVKRALVEKLGPEILDDARQIDRSAVAARVFADPELLRWLESL